MWSFFLVRHPCQSSQAVREENSPCRLFRLLAQLRDMEEAFDGFFDKHHLKLQQYLQLLQYEISFQQVGPMISCPALCLPRKVLSSARKIIRR